MTLEDICAVLGLPAPAGAASLVIQGACTDSRKARPGLCFVCIAGEHVDGHNFAGKAVADGASAVLASHPLPEAVSVPVLLVPDTIKALGAIAHAWRTRFTGKVVGVTGTAGKTTVKEVLAQVLGVHGLTARNALNLNNQIGMPLSILDTTGQEEFWVMEAGISQAHDMEELAPILEPDVALVLNAGVGHTAGLGSQGVAWHKAQLLAHVRKHGTVLVSSDYPELVREARAVCPQAVFFSISGRPVAYRASYNGAAPQTQWGQSEAGQNQPGQNQLGRGQYRLWLDGQPLDIIAPFRGEYGAENAIAVAAVAHVLGLTPQEIAEGFTRATLPVQRFQMREAGAWRIIDDSYNANPLSMKRMVEAAGDVAGAAPLYAVLGAMGELGDVAQTEHERLGRMLAQSGVQAVFWRGGHFGDVRDGLEAEKFSGLLCAVPSVEAFAEAWKSAALKPGVVLCKGSRSNALEELVQALTGLCEEAVNVL